MTDKSLSPQDLSLLDDNAESADPAPSGDAPVADAATKEAETPAAKPNASVFDDDVGAEDGKDDSRGEDKGAKGESETPADDKAKDESKGEEAAKDAPADADGAWRNRIADRILAPAKDKLSAAKFEKRQEQVLKQLGRYKSIDDAIAAGFLAQEKLRSGDHKRLAADATPEEAAAWRKENDIPEQAENYSIPQIPGHEWTQADQPMIDSFKPIAYAANLTQAQVNQLVDWQIKQQQRSTAEYEANLAKADKQDKEDCLDVLRAEYGLAEFKPNMNIMKRLINDDEVFGGAAEKIISARYFDEDSGQWRRLTSLPEIARGLISLASDRYGEGAMAGGDARAVSTNRLGEIEKIMQSDYDRYVREGLADEAMKIRQDQEARDAKRRR